MLRILAAAYEDGWAFVEDGERVVLVRPPYRAFVPVEVSGDSVQTAVTRHGFAAQDLEVADFPALYAMLDDKRVALARAEGRPSLSDRELKERLVRSAPRDILENYLDRVEREQLARGEIDKALDVLGIMSLPGVRNIDDALRGRVAGLIEKCREALAFRRKLVEEAPRKTNPLAALRELRARALGLAPEREAA
jgi:hypothetical protein